AYVLLGAEIYAEHTMGIERPATIDRTNLAKATAVSSQLQLLHTQRVTVTDGDAALGAGFRQLFRDQ
ncbi:MAG: hypothetical protein QOG46_2877, partial [Pseudonocardiales bacterium]|nr:hypothetical protein [Pseudonocardiales bacterium]